MGVPGDEHVRPPTPPGGAKLSAMFLHRHRKIQAQTDSDVGTETTDIDTIRWHRPLKMHTEIQFRQRLMCMGNARTNHRGKGEVGYHTLTDFPLNPRRAGAPKLLWSAGGGGGARLDAPPI